MSERDDYLWDRSGQAEPTTREIEQLFAPLAHRDRELPLEALPAQRRNTPPRRWRNPLLALAATLAMAAAALWWSQLPTLRPGAAARDFVAANEPMRLELGTLAELTLAPGSRLQFLHWRPDEALFRLEHGKLTARVAPPPAVQAGFFQVDTSLGRVIDQGCKYELSVNENDTYVFVTEGAVTFAFPQRTVFVPAGASTNVTSRGPSTPVFLTSSPELRKAVRYFDDLSAKGDHTMRTPGAAAIVKACREPSDSLPLWHLLRDEDPALRELAEQALIELVGPPEDAGKIKDETWDPEVWLAFLRLRAWSTAR